MDSGVLGGFFPMLDFPLVVCFLENSVLKGWYAGCFDFPFESFSFLPSGWVCSGCCCCRGSFVMVAGVLKGSCRGVVVLCIVWLRFLWRKGESLIVDGPGVRSCPVSGEKWAVSSLYKSLMSSPQGWRCSSVSYLNARKPSYSRLSFSSYPAFRFKYFSCSGV